MIYFQWVNGPKIGNIVKYVGTEIDDGEMYVKFEDGSRCNRNYISLLNDSNIENKQVAHISSPENAWNVYYEDIPEIKERYEIDGEGIQQCVQPYIPGRKIKRATPPKFYHVKEIKQFDVEEDYGEDKPILAPIKQESPKDKPQIIKESVIETNKHNKHEKSTDNPVHLLCEKCKKVSCELETNMEIFIPTKALYDIAEDSFDNGGEHFINYIMDNLDMDIIKEQIKKSIEELYRTK